MFNINECLEKYVNNLTETFNREELKKDIIKLQSWIEMYQDSLESGNTEAIEWNKKYCLDAFEKIKSYLPIEEDFGDSKYREISREFSSAWMNLDMQVFDYVRCKEALDNLPKNQDPTQLRMKAKMLKEKIQSNFNAMKQALKKLMKL